MHRQRGHLGKNFIAVRVQIILNRRDLKTIFSFNTRVTRLIESDIFERIAPLMLHFIAPNQEFPKERECNETTYFKAFYLSQESTLTLNVKIRNG
jgi:hypothetical protein